MEKGNLAKFKNKNLNEIDISMENVFLNDANCSDEDSDVDDQDPNVPTSLTRSTNLPLSDLDSDRLPSPAAKYNGTWKNQTKR